MTANTEILIVSRIPQTDLKGEPIYVNHIIGFIGTLDDAVTFARKHNFGGGVEIMEMEGNKVKYIKVNR